MCYIWSTKWFLAHKLPGIRSQQQLRSLPPSRKISSSVEIVHLGQNVNAWAHFIAGNMQLSQIHSVEFVFRRYRSQSHLLAIICAVEMRAFRLLSFSGISIWTDNLVSLLFSLEKKLQAKPSVSSNFTVKRWLIYREMERINKKEASTYCTVHIWALVERWCEHPVR